LFCQELEGNLGFGEKVSGFFKLQVKVFTQLFPAYPYPHPYPQNSKKLIEFTLENAPH